MTTFKRIENCSSSSKPEEDWTFTNACEAGFIKPMLVLPPFKDLRSPMWRIEDQIDTGSCVGWATVDSCMRWHFEKLGLLIPGEKLSVRFVWMASKEIDDFNSRPTSFLEISGTSIKNALDVARKYGCVKEEILPFNSCQLSYAGENTFYSLASEYRILSYFNLKKSCVNGNLVDTVVEDWKEWLAAGNGPIIVRLKKDIHFENASKENPNLDVYSSFPSELAHAVAIVGYTTDNRFIIRNSYGLDWGDDGFAYASMEYAQAAFDEAYGIYVR